MCVGGEGKRCVCVCVCWGRGGGGRFIFQFLPASIKSAIWGVFFPFLIIFYIKLPLISSVLCFLQRVPSRGRLTRTRMKTRLRPLTSRCVSNWTIPLWKFVCLARNVFVELLNWRQRQHIHNHTSMELMQLLQVLNNKPTCNEGRLQISIHIGMHVHNPWQYDPCIHSPHRVTWLPAMPLVIMHKTGRVISAEGIAVHHDDITSAILLVHW